MIYICYYDNEPCLFNTSIPNIYTLPVFIKNDKNVDKTVGNCYMLRISKNNEISPLSLDVCSINPLPDFKHQVQSLEFQLDDALMNVSIVKYNGSLININKEMKKIEQNNTLLSMQRLNVSNESIYQYIDWRITDCV